MKIIRFNLLQIICVHRSFESSPFGLAFIFCDKNIIFLFKNMCSLTNVYVTLDNKFNLTKHF